MNILILYQSRSGHTQAVADAIGIALNDQNHQATVKSVIEVTQADVDATDMLFVGTWIQGFILFGVKPAGADLWVSALPSLEGKPVALFCTYAFNPHNSLDKLKRMLENKGATVIAQQAFQRDQSTNDAQSFAARTLEARKEVAF